MLLTLTDSTLENTDRDRVSTFSLFKHFFQLTNALVMYMNCCLALIVKRTKSSHMFALQFAIFLQTNEYKVVTSHVL